MNTTHRSRTARPRDGFTLVELLVVIAIIGILASIVLPNVARYILKGQVTKAVAEVNSADTALVAILSDTGKSNFNDFFLTGTSTRYNTTLLPLLDGDSDGKADLGGVLTNYQAIQRTYNEIFYELLRLGRDSDVVRAYFKPEVVAKLGTGYMDLGNDPWGENYNFWPGPQRRGLMLHRSYRLVPNADVNNEEFAFQPFYWVDGTISYNDTDSMNPYQQFKANIPGQPAPDELKFTAVFGTTINGLAVHAYGYPAPKDMPVYIWSDGPNNLNDANIVAQFNNPPDDEVYLGGGDDPNNWDNEGGWDSAPQ